MKVIRRLIYLGYYIKRMNWQLLRRFMHYVRNEQGIGSARQMMLIMVDSLRYNISPLEWYQFGFSTLEPTEKGTWAGTGTMYEFQKKANPPGARTVLADKRRFYDAYREFFRHPLWSIDELQANPELIRRILREHERLVFKDATGNCGASVQVVNTSELDADKLMAWMKEHKVDVVEGFAQQHADLNALSPSGVNTVRIFTLLNQKGEYRVLGCRLRISVNSPVDNMAAGNMAAPIDKDTGIVGGPGVYSDITKAPSFIHPITKTSIVGLQVPFWHETLELVRCASLLHPENRSIGWDIVVTPEGPGLIEGNHDWCKLVWQLPVSQGLKHLLDDE